MRYDADRRDLMADQRSYYDVLGVDWTASAEVVRDAFRRLVRERHPDRLRGEARAEAEREFQAITEAYNVLSNTESRERYDRMRSTGTPRSAADPREIAKVLVTKAAAAARGGDLQQADELFRQAVGHDPENAKAQHLYGILLAERLGRLDEALRCVDQAAKLDPLNPKILLDSSRLFARAGMVTRAKRLARSAAELSPGDEAVESWLLQLEGENSRG